VELNRVSPISSRQLTASLVRLGFLPCPSLSKINDPQLEPTLSFHRRGRLLPDRLSLNYDSAGINHVVVLERAVHGRMTSLVLHTQNFPQLLYSESAPAVLLFLLRFGVFNVLTVHTTPRNLHGSLAPDRSSL
jgi:hypothetical protein